MEATQIELIDSLLYMYILCGWINMILGIVFMVIILRNWSNASSATSPSQYNLRTKYLISMLLCVASAFLYGFLIVFGVSNTVIPWEYQTLPLIYQELMIFALILTAFSFALCLLLSFLFRAAILYGEVSKLQSVMLNVFAAFFMILIVLLAILVAMDGVNLGHVQDRSTGIGVLRALEKSVAIACRFTILPLFVIGFFFFAFVYSYKLKLLKQVSSKSERDVLMPVVLKESILVTLACLDVIVYVCWRQFVNLFVVVRRDNVALFSSLFVAVSLLCIFFMLQFNHGAFYKCCYFPSLLWLNVCCFHAKIEGDAQLLELQCGLHGDYDATKQQESEVDDETDAETDREALNPDDL